MTNKIALWLAALIIGFLVLDAVWLHWNAPVALGQILLSVLDWLAFWR